MQSNKLYILRCLLALVMATWLGLGINNLSAQIKARTETGRAVILYGDGTWKYEEGNAIGAFSELSHYPIAQFKPEAATTCVASTHVNARVFINATMWEFRKIEPAEAREYEFWSKWGDGKAVLTTEERSVRLQELRMIALSNAVKFVPDIRLLKEELRQVNNLEMLCLELEGTINGIPQTFMGYYYSGKSGTVQFLTYGSNSFFSENRKSFQQLLNGLIIDN